MATKFSAYGALLKRVTGGPTTIGQIRDIGGPGLSLDTLDVTTHDSGDAWRDFVGGLKDGGEVSLELVWDPDNSTQTLLRTDLDGRTVASWSITFVDPTPAVITFNALVTAFEPSANVGDELTVSATLKVTGEPVFS